MDDRAPFIDRLHMDFWTAIQVTTIGTSSSRLHAEQSPSEAGQLRAQACRRCRLCGKFASAVRRDGMTLWEVRIRGVPGCCSSTASSSAAAHVERSSWTCTACARQVWATASPS